MARNSRGTEHRGINPGSMDSAGVEVGVEQVAIRIGGVQRLLLAGLSPGGGVLRKICHCVGL